jgi:CxxC motif-containing protein (DUF1111 family)
MKEKTTPVLATLVAALILHPLSAGTANAQEEAPAGFDNLTNGFVDQSTFDNDREVFEEREEIDEGLGPVYNAQSCLDCHQNPISGGISQVTEVRAGRRDRSGRFVAAQGGSLINDRAIHPEIHERVPDGAPIRALRSSLNTLGDGFVEAIADDTLKEIAARQPFESRGRIRGQWIEVPVLESPGTKRVGRFGWKTQHASLLSFSADAYLNEMGITSPMAPTENTSNGNPVDAYDEVVDPEDGGEDVEGFARFMRATKVPPRDQALAATPAAMAGSELFELIGCAHCHVSTMVTAPTGTVINGGAFVVPPALGDKTIHPFSDFLLHNVGTGDGIVQDGGEATGNKLRTPPLWGVRTRVRLMHDGASMTLNDAILRHRGEALIVALRYRKLKSDQKNAVITFLKSL